MCARSESPANIWLMLHVWQMFRLTCVRLFVTILKLFWWWCSKDIPNKITELYLYVKYTILLSPVWLWSDYHQNVLGDSLFESVVSEKSVWCGFCVFICQELPRPISSTFKVTMPLRLTYRIYRLWVHVSVTKVLWLWS